MSYLKERLPFLGYILHKEKNTTAFPIQSHRPFRINFKYSIENDLDLKNKNTFSLDIFLMTFLSEETSFKLLKALNYHPNYLIIKFLC